LGYIAFYPYDPNDTTSANNLFMKTLIDDFKDDFLNTTWQDQVITFKSKNDLDKFISSSNSNDTNYKNICLGIGFNKFGDDNNDYDYSIRFKERDSSPTFLFKQKVRGISSRWKLYMNNN